MTTLFAETTCRLGGGGKCDRPGWFHRPCRGASYVWHYTGGDSRTAGLPPANFRQPSGLGRARRHPLQRSQVNPGQG